MLYELESAPFAQKPSTVTTNKLKTLPSNPSSSSTSSCSTQVNNNNNKEQTFLNNNIKQNGITSGKVYGPELPASMNGGVVVNGNGRNDSSSSSSSSESDTETVKSETERVLPAPSMPLLTSKIPEKPSAPRDDINTKSPPVLKPQNRPSSSSFKSTTTAASAPVLTKLVPYEMDDSSNCSDESSCSRAETDTTRITTKAATVGEWKVTAFIPSSTATTTTTTTQETQSSEGGKSWERKKSENSTTVGELMRMSHSGYGAPVSTWNGTRAQLDKEVNNERREERKRALCDNSEPQGRGPKHPKLNNSHGSYKSNPGYNPIQVIHQ